MPIFQDDLGRGRSTPPSKPPFLSRTSSGEDNLRRKSSEESIRTELCEGPLLDVPNRSSPIAGGELEEPQDEDMMQGITDRGELIERLKRGQSPTWVPNRHLESLIHEYDDRSRLPSYNEDPPSLLSPAEITENAQNVPLSEVDNLQAGLAIERPRSALHSGDFTQHRPQERQDISQLNDLRDRQISYIASQSPWLSTSPPRHHLSPFPRRDTQASPTSHSIFDSQSRSRAPSLSSSYSSSFVLKPPTSPLVQSESNDEPEPFTAGLNPIDIDRSGKRNSRRHTLQASHSFQSSSTVPSAYERTLPYPRRDATYPYQAHQPRRSITASQSMSNTGSSPQTPAFVRSRRPSYTSDSSPLQHASMVGSYEESILRGRMSTTPSRPLDFVAEIGVLGLGKCKSSLRCPPHVTLPFPAVFYSYGSTPHGRSVKTEDGPSPYVGQIDLENGLPNPDETKDARRRRREMVSNREESMDLDMPDAPEPSEQQSERGIRRSQKQRRRSRSPRAPPGGSYRIPEKGQIQIIIKNPNKTAVKLFLVPYDLNGMESGTKTFIRQRIYSAGPIIDLPPLTSSLQNPSQDIAKDRGTLRYLVHLQICSPSRGRFYLYKTIRVVFANRVPDGKEKLQNEIQLPQPRFSVYKPSRDSNHGQSSMAAASLAMEKAFRRRSSGFPSAVSNRMLDAMDGVIQSIQPAISGGSTYPHADAFSTTPVEPIPFNLYRQKTTISNIDNQAQSLTSSKSSRPTTSQDSGLSGSLHSEGSIGGYDKLSKGDIGYGGNAFVGSFNGQPATSEGLLALKLKGLGVGKTNLESPHPNGV